MPRSKKGQSRATSAPTGEQDHDVTHPQKQKRQSTVYDAVAGRVSSTGFLPAEPRVSRYRDTPSSSTVAVPPEEVLFRRKGAPMRYEENDIYWAAKHLKEGQTLPESDLLKSIHTYASDLYERTTKHRGAVDFESFDETALLCMGILLEETAEHVLGDTGDFAFIEGEEVDDVESEPPTRAKSQMSEAKVKVPVPRPAKVAKQRTSDLEKMRKHKKRKFKDDKS